MDRRRTAFLVLAALALGYALIEEIRLGLGDGSIDTGLDPVTGLPK